MILHNLKVAVRNLMKYKLQTIISVLSIAIGIVTLAFTHSALENAKLPPICGEPYYSFAYVMRIKLPESERPHDPFNLDMRKALKGDGGLKNAERIAFPAWMNLALPLEFHLSDSTVRKGYAGGFVIDPEYPDYAGLRSAVTGKKIRKLKTGEAIVSEKLAKQLFRDKNPIGAVQTMTTPGQPIPLTVVDVYKNLPLTMRQGMGNDAIYFCLADSVEGLSADDDFYATTAELTLKEKRTAKQLQKELEQRLKPWNAKVTLTKYSEYSDYGIINAVRFIGYLIGSLILLSAIIGFLRMQIQLVWLRNREISLRIVNGASRNSLFMLLMLEIGISLSMAVCLAVVLGKLLQDFLSDNLTGYLEMTGAIISDLWPFSLAIGGGLFAVCSLIVYAALYRIYKSRRGLTVYMRGKRNHLFRNVMLGVQTVICFVFVCSSLILIWGGREIKKAYNIPQNDEYLKEYLCLRFTYGMDDDKLYEEIKRLPELDKMVPRSGQTFHIKEFSDNPEALERLGNHNFFQFYCSEDTTLLDVLGIEVDWTDKDATNGEYLLMQKGLYDQLTNFGILNNSLTIEGYNITLPIAGTFIGIPYEDDDNYLIAISPTGIGGPSKSWILVPKPGKGKALERSVNETIERIAPEIIDKLVVNYREVANPVPGFIETAVKGGWILGCVSLLICMMGIFSTITLDTRSRKKEVAIRKVNGAKSGDIYRMFGKVYAWLIALSLFIAVPVSVIFGEKIKDFVNEKDSGASFSPEWPIALGCVMVIIFILGIVFWQIRRVMRVDPARIIAKE